MHPTDNTILITGGTSGIGRALAEAFHARGNQVIIAGRRQALLDEVTAAHPAMHGIRLDIEDPKSMTAFVAQVRDQFPRLNILINNAGISRRENLAAGNSDISVATSIIATNIRGVLEITLALLPTLMQQPSSRVITTTSGLAFVPFAQFPTYCATKAFLHSWLQSLRFQLRDSSVDVIELVPPYVQTELSGPEQATDPHAMPLAEYIAEVMQFFDNPNPSGSEVLVERVKALRFAERSQDYERIFWANNHR
jgi:uncharacterized oxidoreductase